ncbi:MAG TPA: uracil-DNA glycosylase [Opitutaceae bacterium]|nr:uracil-DNA glycosylase [Opitutaceae bacterium]
MRSVLLALTDELRRLKAEGVKTVPVSDQSLAALRRLAAARRETADRRREAGRRSPDVGGRKSATGDQGVEPTDRAPKAASEEPVSRGPPPVSGDAKLPPPPQVVLPPGDKRMRWQALRELALNHPVCRAHVPPGKQVVFGVGSLDARIMFVGEAPGADEEQQGEPFVGPAGQLLTRMIKAMGLERSDVYIGNIMNWRPELPRRADGTQAGNREPTPEEMAFCLPFISAQIEVVDPALLVALGATAARGLLGARSFRTLGEVRGRWHDYRGRPLRVTYHPSYLLRKELDGPVMAKRAKRTAWEDFLAVMERAGLPISEKQRSYFLR